MKFKILFAVIGISFFAIACKSKIAADYSEAIAKKENALGPEVKEATNKLVRYFAAYDYDSIASVSSQMEAKVETLLREIKNKPAPKLPEAENFKQASIRYLNYLKSIYTSYKNYGSQTTPEGRIIAQDEMTVINSQEEVMADYLKVAQQKFAKANGFKIKTNKKIISPDTQDTLNNQAQNKANSGKQNLAAH